MRRSTLLPAAFTTKRLIREFEGGAIFEAEHEGKHYLIVNEAGLLDMLSAEDREEGDAVKVFEFDAIEELTAYLETRGWRP